MHFLAVARAWHGRGVGGGLVRFVEQVVALRSGRWLHVKPLAPSDPDADYARARMFLHEAGLCAAVRTSDDLGLPHPGADSGQGARARYELTAERRPVEGGALSFGAAGVTTGFAGRASSIAVVGAGSASA